MTDSSRTWVFVSLLMPKIQYILDWIALLKRFTLKNSVNIHAYIFNIKDRSFNMFFFSQKYCRSRNFIEKDLIDMKNIENIIKKLAVNFGNIWKRKTFRKIYSDFYFVLANCFCFVDPHPLRKNNWSVPMSLYLTNGRSPFCRRS